jgi:hypothetical protein
MKSKFFGIISVFILSTVAAICLLTLGLPEQEDPIQLQVKSHIEELYHVVRGSDGSKASFLSHGFCTDGTLEELALAAVTSEQINLVNNLSRDCVIVTYMLNT